MSPDQQKELDVALVIAAQDGRREDVRSLIAQGANVTYDHQNAGGLDTPLIEAAHKGHLDCVLLLLHSGANANQRRKGGQGGTAITFTKMPEIKKILLNPPNEIMFERYVSNRVMEEVFDFKSKERITLIRANSKGQVEAVTRETFGQIEDTPSLREAFNEHVKRGGMMSEHEVFPNAMLKPQIRRQTP